MSYSPPPEQVSATANLRFRNGVLEQMFSIASHDPKYDGEELTKHRHEWRPVPSVPSILSPVDPVAE